MEHKRDYANLLPEWSNIDKDAFMCNHSKAIDAVLNNMIMICHDIIRPVNNNTEELKEGARKNECIFDLGTQKINIQDDPSFIQNNINNYVDNFLYELRRYAGKFADKAVHHVAFFKPYSDRSQPNPFLEIYWNVLQGTSGVLSKTALIHIIFPEKNAKSVLDRMGKAIVPRSQEERENPSKKFKKEYIEAWDYFVERTSIWRN